MRNFRLVFSTTHTQTKKEKRVNVRKHLFELASRAKVLCKTSFTLLVIKNKIPILLWNVDKLAIPVGHNAREKNNVILK